MIYIYIYMHRCIYMFTIHIEILVYRIGRKGYSIRWTVLFLESSNCKSKWIPTPPRARELEISTAPRHACNHRDVVCIKTYIPTYLRIYILYIYTYINIGMGGRHIQLDGHFYFSIFKLVNWIENHHHRTHVNSPVINDTVRQMTNTIHVYIRSLGDIWCPTCI
jgi:hypothetical protein